MLQGRNRERIQASFHTSQKQPALHAQNWVLLSFLRNRLMKWAFFYLSWAHSPEAFVSLRVSRSLHVHGPEARLILSQRPRHAPLQLGSFGLRAAHILYGRELHFRERGFLLRTV